MGRNKALLSLTEGGPPLVSLVVEALRPIADEVLLVGSDAEPYSFLDLPSVPDVYENAGSLGGIYSGLAAARNEHALAVACDMPFLNGGLLAFMASLPRDYDALVPVLDEPEPMHAVYSKACLPLMKAQLEQGRYKIIGWFDRARIQYIQREAVLEHDPKLRSFYNMNTPGEWAAARELYVGAADAGQSNKKRAWDGP